MKQIFIKLFVLLTAFAFTFSATAQHQVNAPGGRTLSTTIKKEAPANWGKSTEDIIFYEDFSDNGFENWAIDGEGLENWEAAPVNLAGGEPPEAYMMYSPVFVGTSRLVSPVINTSGYEALSLTFLHLLDLWAGGGGFWVAVETTSDGGETWNEVWELYWETTDNYAAFEVLAVSTDDVGSEDFQFCFKFWDNSDLLDFWAIDNITLAEATMYDVSPIALTGFEENIFEEDEVLVSTSISNYGSETVSFDVTLEINDGSSVVFENTQTVSDLAFGEQAQVDFESWVAVGGLTWTAVVTTELAGDENPDNDVLSYDFVVFTEESYCIPAAYCVYGDGFTDFAWAGIENYGSGCSDLGYGVFADLTAEIEIGNTYTASMASGYGSNIASMWIDFDQDYEFEEWERVVTDFPMAAAGVMADVDITVPGTALLGTTTMRIAANYNAPSSPDPCGTFVYGEFEDYSVVVTGTSIMYNAMTKSIDIDPLMPAGDITPMATVKNMGVETISFPVTMTVDGTGYSSTVQVSDLAFGDEVQLEFETWSAPTGNYTIEVCTELSGDEVPDNDCMTAEISTITYDVGVEEINMFSTIMLGDVVPKATIVNYGFETVTFPVSMEISDGYESIIEIVDLPGQDTIIVDFETWTNSVGQHSVDVCTDLSNDEQTENDCEDMLVTISEDARQKVVMELFTGLW